VSALSFEDLGGGYGDTQVLRHVSARLTPGEVLGVIGRNGVGKSTLLRLLSGALPAMTGHITLCGQRVNGWPAHRRQRAGLATMPQERLVFDPLTVRENLTLHLADRSLQRYDALFDEFPRLRERLHLPAGRLSGGEKKLVAFARALADGAPVTLLDEPSEGVQPENLARMADCIHRRRDAGAAFLIVEQNLSFLLPLVQQVLVLDHGEVVRVGPAGLDDREDLIQHLRV
jgi:ABC-type branched-subunit amino acid transport system ATPase component